jgi:hypothetical protein
MPGENRRNKKQPDQPAEQQHDEEPEPIVKSLDRPSWIIYISGPKEAEEANPGAPYGYVDADINIYIKAYFRTMDVQIRDWQENRDEDAGEDGDTYPNDRMIAYDAFLSQLLFDRIIEKRLFFYCHYTIRKLTNYLVNTVNTSYST